VFAEDEVELLLAEADTPEHLEAMVGRRVDGLPLEHVLGWAAFAGHRIRLGPGVFVPRPRTQLLAQQARRRARTGQVLLDLCCGSGALAAVLADAVAPGEVHAADVDPVAVAWARVNVGAVGGDVYEGDLFDPLPVRLRGRVNLLLANTPYLPTEAIGLLPREAREYEARVALDGGPDGLDLQRRVAAQAPDWLAPGGHLFVETSAAQAAPAAALMAAAGLATEIVRDEDLDATVVIGTAR
jgi:release factor glutamine methyltransferase